MLVSALTAPIYARSLIKVLLRRKLSFNVTAKGTSTSADRLGTFRYSLMWAVVPVVIMTVAVLHQRPYPMMMVWTGVILAVCLAPIWIWRVDRTRAARDRDTERAGRHRSGDASELDLAYRSRDEVLPR
jgi:hypothetical protein